MKYHFSDTDFLLAIAFVLIYVAYLGGFGENGWLFYLQHTPPILFILPPIFYCGFSIYKKRVPVVALLITIIISINLFVFLGRSITYQSTGKSNQQNLRLCSWNTAYFFKWNKEVGLTTLANQNCTVILLQEIWKSEFMTKEIAEVRDNYFPQFEFFSQGEFVILAPKDSVVSVHRSLYNGHFAVTLLYNNRTVRFTSVHLWNPITDMPTLDSNKKITVVPAIQARERQKKELITFIQDTQKIPHLIIGDFNTLQNGKILRDITKNKNGNSFSLLSTHLFSNKDTYPAKFPFLQIDYAFISETLRNDATLSKKCIAEASDHCLLIVDLVL